MVMSEFWLSDSGPYILSSQTLFMVLFLNVLSVFMFQFVRRYISGEGVNLEGSSCFWVLCCLCEELDGFEVYLFLKCVSYLNLGGGCYFSFRYCKVLGGAGGGVEAGCFG